MKFGEPPALDGVDAKIIGLLQDDCKASLAKIGEQVRLSAPAVVERIHKLERAGVITGYHAAVDARRLGLDITAFIGVVVEHPRFVEGFGKKVEGLPDVLECHDVTGEYTLLLKVKTANTSSLKDLIARIRSIRGVARTETMVVFSTRTERVQVPLDYCRHARGTHPRRENGRRASTEGVTHR